MSKERRQAEIRDAATMRALSHPARIAVLDRLFSGEPATATELAEVCGLSPSATSYHLRALAKVGLIEEAPSRGDGRERVWQSQHRGLNVGTGPERGAAERAADRELAGMFIDIEDERARAWLARRDAEPYEWYVAASSAGVQLMVTAEEMAELNERVLALLEPYSRRTRQGVPEEARAVDVTYRVVPRS
ncbi:metalloregulator ArsR/SmtB family transcription factor [Dactylosporangium sp. NPDC051485]|uniref:ArsR/SmtB family transcription factor n=1 Tax=Dactylosporangium sp. NPDC051485 TaxID=3154846 RepID=UPI00342EABF4